MRCVLVDLAVTHHENHAAHGCNIVKRIAIHGDQVRFVPYRNRRLKLQFRTEAFNAFKTVRFGRPNTSVVSNQFGPINSQANSPPQIQFGLKLL